MHAVSTLHAKEENLAKSPSSSGILHMTAPASFRVREGASGINIAQAASSWFSSLKMMSPFLPWLLTDAVQLYSTCLSIPKSRHQSWLATYNFTLFPHTQESKWVKVMLLYGEPQISPAFLFNNLLNLDMLWGGGGDTKNKKHKYLWITLQLTMTRQCVYCHSVLGKHGWICSEANLPFLSRTLIRYLFTHLLFFYSFHKHLLCYMLRIRDDQTENIYWGKLAMSTKEIET